MRGERKEIPGEAVVLIVTLERRRVPEDEEMREKGMSSEEREGERRNSW
jgi:hypothetical protein